MPVLPRWSWSDACARRLERHGLRSPLSDAGPAQVAAAMCGAQAQVQQAAEWSIAVRLADADRASVQRALWTERCLVRTYGPRGTIHLLASRDLPVWTAALSELPAAVSGTLSPAQAAAVVDAVSDALAVADLTIDELHDAVVARAGTWAGDLVLPAFGGMWPRWRQAMALAATRGALCFGPPRGRKVTYAHPRRWVPGFRPADPGQAVAELVRRYLHAYGPATPRQFAQWLGAPRQWAADVFESMSGVLDEVHFCDARAWLNAGDSQVPAAAPRGLRLLPYFDSYVIGCHPRAMLFPAMAQERALNRTGQAGTYPVLLIDGLVAGIWHQRKGSGRTIAVTVEPFLRLSEAQQRELERQAEHFCSFLGGVPSLTFGPVQVASHR